MSYATHLRQLGLNSYLYCPKSDVFLRKRWRESWPEGQYQEMEELAEAYATNDVDFGLGLSPFELYRKYDPESRRALKDKVQNLASLGAPTLAILFDDMPGDVEDLALRQAEIMSDVQSWAPSQRLLVCPTYYSFDPVLEEYFGPMPEEYWENLGRDLSADIEIFWTGNKVCSEAISLGDVEQVNAEFGRKVTLWDNYPVNDGAQRSNFLYCGELDQRDPQIGSQVMGHYCNPMNQAQLSLLALVGLPKLYGRDCASVQTYLEENAFSKGTFEQIQLDAEEFETLGLSGMGARRCAELERLYAGFSDEVASEIAGWLREEYSFDPACLTD